MPDRGSENPLLSEEASDPRVSSRLETETLPQKNTELRPKSFSPTLAPAPDQHLDSVSIPPSEAFTHVIYEKVFLFVNPDSGGNAAAEFTTGGVQRIVMTEPRPTEVWIFNIKDGVSGHKDGFKLLRSEIVRLEALALAATDELERSPPASSDRLEMLKMQSQQFIRVMAAGGDGTVMWTAAEIDAHKCPTSRLAIGVIPYGTGNDFSRALCWPQSEKINPFENQLNNLRHLLNNWLMAKVALHDLWEVVVVINEEGQYFKIDSKTRQKVPYNKDTTKLCVPMSNYFSMGVESRIGIGFDRHRTKSKFWNKYQYVKEGIKKSIFKKTPLVDDVAASMVSMSRVNLDSAGGNKGLERELFYEALADFEAEEDDLIFSTTETGNQPCLRGCASLIALNIPSWGSGNDIWANAVNRSALRHHDVEKSKTMLEAQQVMGDQKLEFLSFKNAQSLGIEAAFKGNGRRIHQGRGPWKIAFKPLNSTTRAYFQVDGEFFIMTKPRYIGIRWREHIRVLVRNNAVRQNYTYT